MSRGAAPEHEHVIEIVEVGVVRQAVPQVGSHGLPDGRCTGIACCEPVLCVAQPLGRLCRRRQL